MFPLAKGGGTAFGGEISFDLRGFPRNGFARELISDYGLNDRMTVARNEQAENLSVR